MHDRFGLREPSLAPAAPAGEPADDTMAGVR
jgi:hypothetical protein